MRNLRTYAWEWGPLTVVAAIAALALLGSDAPALVIGAFYTSLAVMQFAMVRARWERDSLAAEVRALRGISDRHQPTPDEYGQLNADIKAFERGERP